MSAGYFVDVVFPRELRLTPRQSLTVDKSVWYTDPVGSHPALLNAVQNRIRTVTGELAEPTEYGVALVGHGTNRHKESSATTYRHASRLRAQTGFAEVNELFLDEAPRVDSITDHFSVRNIIVVPLFIAEGTHTTEDIPHALGIPPGTDQSYHTPEGYSFWYTEAVGTDPLVADIALELAESSISDHLPTKPVGTPTDTDAPQSQTAVNESTELHDARASFIDWLTESHNPSTEERATPIPHPTKRWGELSITTTDSANPRFSLCHHQDAPPTQSALEVLETVTELRDRTRYTRNNTYRPLRSALTLPTGWLREDLSPTELTKSIDIVYPGSIIDWYRLSQGMFEQRSFQTITDRYTGMYESVSTISPEERERVITRCCEHCVKHPTWHNPEGTTDSDVGDETIPCPEPCPIFVETARKLQNATSQTGEPTDGNTDDNPGPVECVIPRTTASSARETVAEWGQQP
jgi:sirohydrochlorin cobaltochelatase